VTVLKTEPLMHGTEPLEVHLLSQEDIMVHTKLNSMLVVKNFIKTFQMKI